MNPTPTSSMQRPTCSGLRLMFAPSASSTSALPDCEDTARLPCLATRPPAAPHTNLAPLAMFKPTPPPPPAPQGAVGVGRVLVCRVLGRGGDVQTGRQGGATNRERMMARGGEGSRAPAEPPWGGGPDHGGLPVHDPSRMPDPPAEGLADRL